MKNTKNIFDYTHVKGVRAVCLLNAKTKEVCGKIIANYSDNPAGSVCSAQVMLWHNAPVFEIAEVKSREGSTEMQYPSIGKAGGYGYDKLSQAIWESLKKLGIDTYIKVNPGAGNQRQAFEDAGFIYVEVC